MLAWKNLRYREAWWAMGYSPWVCRELDTTQPLNNSNNYEKKDCRCFSTLQLGRSVFGDVLKVTKPKLPSTDCFFHALLLLNGNYDTEQLCQRGYCQTQLKKLIKVQNILNVRFDSNFLQVILQLSKQLFISEIVLYRLRFSCSFHSLSFLISLVILRYLVLDHSAANMTCHSNKWTD